MTQNLSAVGVAEARGSAEYHMGMNQEQTPDAPEPIEQMKPPPALVEVADAPLAEPSAGGAKLFVIFFLTLVPLLGIALLAMVIYSLLTR